MYCDFFGLRLRPFEDRPDTRFFHPTSSGEEALAMMEYECHFGKGAALFLGEAGTGKTLHVRMLLQRLHATDHVVVLNWPHSGQTDLVREVMKGFGLTVPTKQSASRGIARLRRHLLRNTEGDHRSILIVDQAENLTEENLAQLATLSDLQRDGQRLLNIVLSAQPQFRNALESPDVAGVRQQFFGERVVSPLTPEETVAYILHRLKVAGAVGDELFEPDALRMIYEASNGVPRLINHICNASMLAAYGSEQTTITESIVADVTSRGTETQRTVSASELGLESNEQVASGWSMQSSDPGSKPETETGRQHKALKVAEDFPSIESSQQDQPEMIRAEGLLARLDSALARAERVDATTHASLSQQTAVEKHLHTLIQEAYRVVVSLRDASDCASQCTREVEERMEQARSQAEERIIEFDQQLSRATEIAQQTQNCLEGISEACANTDEVRSQLSSSTQQMVSGSDEVKSRIADLMSGMEMSEAAANRLQNLLNHEVSLTSRADQRAEEIRVRLDSALAQARQRQTEAIEKTIEQSQQKLDELMIGHQERLDRSINDLQEKLRENESQVTSLEERQASLTATQRDLFHNLLEEENQVATHAIATHRQHLEEVLDESEQRFRALESLVDASREKAEVTLTLCKNTFVETTQNFNVSAQSHRDVVDDLEQRHSALCSNATTLLGDLEGMEDKSKRMTQTVDKIKTTVAVLTTRTERTAQDLSTAVSGGQRLIGEVQSATGRLEGLQSSVAATLGDLGSASERYRALREQVQAAEETAARLATERESSGDAIAKLHSAAAAVYVDIDSAREVHAESSRLVQQLESQNTIAIDAIQHLTDSTEQSHGLVERLASVNEQAENLAAQHETAELTSTRLEELIDCAGSLNEAFQGTIAHSDEKMGQLSSHHAAAVHVLGQLNDVTQAGHTLLETMNQSSSEASKFSQSLAEILPETRSLEHACRESAKELTHCSDRAEELTQHTTTATEHAAQILAELSGQVDSARLLKEYVTSAEELLLQTSKSQTVIKEATEQADTARSNLVDVTALAARNRIKLAEQESSARQAVQECDRSSGEANLAAGRLGGQVEVAQRALESRDPLLAEFAERASAVEKQLVDLQSAADTIDQHVCEMAQRPSEILSQAREQAVQLEQVCKTVRKVFAGLAQATLEAHQQTQESQDAAKEAFAQLSQVTAKTQRLVSQVTANTQQLVSHVTDETQQLVSHVTVKTQQLTDILASEGKQRADTLKEWVAEATHVQARLERTLAQSPTIQETHSSDTRRRMSVIPASRARGVEFRSSGELKVLNQPPGGNVVGSERSAKNPTRAQEIVNLLEEAKRATVETSGS